MTMRRRRKKLSSLVYNMDRRIRSVELKKTVFAKAGLSPSVDDEVEPTLPDETIYAGDAPNAWHRITGAYYYPARIIGSGDRAEIFLAASDSGLGAERGDVISISRLQSSVGGVDILTTDSDPDYYTVRAHGTPNWELTASNTRESKQVNGTEVYYPLDDVGSGVGHTYLFSPASDTTYSFPPFTLRYELKFRALVSKHSATTTTATITFSSGHHYQVDDVIEVMDLPSGYRGIDGIFRVKAITSTTLTYDFDTPLALAISEATASSGVYVYSVAQEYVREGATFINSSDGTVYYWDGIRYTRSAPAGLSNDGNPPSPPTDLVLTTSGYQLADGAPRSRVDLSWTAPTTSSGGGDLDDLAGYRIFISETGFADWTQKITYEKAVTSQTITNLDQNKEYYFRVIAFDSFGLDSEGLDDSIITGVAALSVNTPSAPIIPTVRFAVATVKWDGKDSTGGVIPSRLLDHVEVHASTTSGFTPSESTLVGKIFSASDFVAVSDLTYNATYYFKFVAKDKSGNLTTASTQTSAVIKPLVDADLIAAELNSPLSVWPFAPKAVTAGALADGALDASTVFGLGVITQDAIAANAIGATQIAANAITAGKIEANAVTTAKLDALAVTAAKIATNAIEADKINAGAVTAVKINAGAVTAEKIDAGAVTAAKILATDTFVYSNGSGEEARVGQNAIPAQFGTPGLAVSVGGTVTGWAGAFGAGAFEVGTNFTGNYIDMYQGSDSRVDYSLGGIDLNGRSCYVDIGYSESGIVKTEGQAYFYSNSTAAFRIYDGDSNLGISISNRVAGNPGYFRTILTSGGSTRVNLDSDGVIRCVSLTQTSSRRFKTDIQNYTVPSGILDVPIVKFRYDYEKMGYGAEGISEEMVGVIAEDLVALGLSDVVLFDEENPELPTSVDYGKLAIMLIPIVKSLKLEVEDLKTKVNQT